MLEGCVRPISLGRLPGAARTLLPVAALRADERLRGIVLILGATMLFSTSDVTAKFVEQSLPLVEVAWVRYCVFLLFAVLPALRGGVEVLHTRRPGQQIMRGLSVLVSALLFLAGLRLLPLADAAAINFVSPLLITALAVPMLGEVVGLSRWIALLVGLSGAVLAAQPGAGAFQWGAVFPLLSALAWAFAMVLTRRFAATERPQTTLFWSAVSGLTVLTLLLPFDVRVPTPGELGLCLLIGVVASGGQWLVVLGYRLAPASLLAPFSYVQLIWSTTYGFLVFDAVPSVATVAGAVIIAGSGLYTIGRTRART